MNISFESVLLLEIGIEIVSHLVIVKIFIASIFEI